MGEDRTQKERGKGKRGKGGKKELDLLPLDKQF